MLRVDDVIMIVYMSIGIFIIQGSFVLDWFLKRFFKVMEYYDMFFLEFQLVFDGYLEYEKNWNELMRKDKEKLGEYINVYIMIIVLNNFLLEINQL